VRGTHFGYQQLEPCPACGTPRVGSDWDDDYYIYPGIYTPATCDVVYRPDGCLSSTYVCYRLPWNHPQESFPADSPLTNCPKCGAELVTEEVQKTYEDRWGRRATFREIHYRCPNTRPHVQKLPGCAKCRKAYSHFGLNED
jgi:hypothetical protein